MTDAPRLPALMLSLALLPAAGMAQEVTGTITGTLDGTEMEWRVTEHDGTSQSEYIGWGVVYQVTLFGQPEGAGAFDTTEALTVDMSIEATDPPVEARDVSVRYTPEEMFKGYVSSYDAAPAVEVTRLEETADGLSVAGTLTAQLGWSDGPGDAADMSDAKTLEARFDAVIRSPR